MDEKNYPDKKPVWERVKEEWDKFNTIKQQRESIDSATLPPKTQQIFVVANQFVVNQLKKKVNDGRETLEELLIMMSNAPAKPEDALWQGLFSGQATQYIRIFTYLLNLSIQFKNKNLSVDEQKKLVNDIRGMVNLTPGAEDFWWGSIKVGLVTALILGLIAGIIAAAVLINPAFLVFLVIPGAAAVWIIFSGIIEHGTEDSFFSNFYKTGFSKELDELADRIQDIINGPDLGPVPVASQVPQSTSASSFGSVYQPDPEGKEKPVEQSSVRTTLNKTDPNL